MTASSNRSSSWGSVFDNVDDDVYTSPSPSSWSELDEVLQGIFPSYSSLLFRKDDPRLLMEQPQATTSSWDEFNYDNVDNCANTSQSTYSEMHEFLQGLYPPILPEPPQAVVTTPQHEENLKTSYTRKRKVDSSAKEMLPPTEQPQATASSWTTPDFDNVDDCTIISQSTYGSEPHDFSSLLLQDYDPLLFVLTEQPQAAASSWYAFNFDNVGDCANISQTAYSEMHEFLQSLEEAPPLLPVPPRAAVVTPQREKNSKKSNTRKRKVDSSAKDYIEDTYTDVDVLLGRGGLANRHPGNQAYMREKEQIQSRYLAASKVDKTDISQELVDWVHGRGGRFLKVEEDEDRWYVVDNDTARKKASQTLREIRTAGNRT
jgi:hypothetical protein